MLDAIALLPRNNQPVVLFTRHSIRELADANGFAGYKLPLTDVGRELAFAWGEWLSKSTSLKLTTCVSSPISRCVDTANLMLQGTQTNQNLKSIINIDQHNLLVEPGSFVVDIAKAGPYFRQQGALQFINGFLNQQLPGMKIPMQGAQDILRLLFDHAPKQDHGLLLAVSHDTILSALFAIMLNKTQITQADWPEMMEGAFLWFEGDQFENVIIHWVWRGVQYQFYPTTP